MRKLDRLLSKTLSGGVAHSFNILGAYCHCLTPEEACELLFAAATGRPDLRLCSLRKVSADLEAGVQSCHRNLVALLLEAICHADAKRRQSIGYCLSELVGKVDANLQSRIEAAFLASKQLSVRNRGYKSCANHVEERLPELEQAWNRFKDVECAWLIVKSFPVKFLIENREELGNALWEGWQISRLYLRMGRERPSLLNELREVDPISFCYVRAKLGRPISQYRAIEIASASYESDRFGLLVWAFGRMRLWRVLEHIEKQLPEINKRRFEHMIQSISHSYETGP